MGNKPQCGEHCCNEEKREEKNGPKEWDRHRHNPKNADVVTGEPQGRALVKVSQGLSASDTGLEEKEEPVFNTVSPADVTRLVPEVVGTSPKTLAPGSEPETAQEVWRSMAQTSPFQMSVPDGTALVGVKVAKVGRTLVIKEVDAYGLLKDKVKLGDIIVDVNGECRDVDLMYDTITASERSQPLKLGVVRILQVSVEVDKSSNKLGIGLAVDKTTDVLYIMAFADSGTVIDHNERAEAGQQIFAGDEVCEVNGQGGGGEDLMARMGAAEKSLKLLIRRKAP